MNFTRRTKLALGALTFALVALSLDRWILPPPSSAVASDRDGSATTERADRRGNVGKSDTDAQWLTFVSERLKQLNAARSALIEAPAPLARDPFVGAPTAARAPAAEMQRKAADEALSVAQFREKNRLSATILGPDPIALVGRRTLRVGDELDGLRLDRVGEGWAEFLSGVMRVRLEVPRAGRNVGN